MHTFLLLLVVVVVVAVVLVVVALLTTLLVYDRKWKTHKCLAGPSNGCVIVSIAAANIMNDYIKCSICMLTPPLLVASLLSCV